MVIEPRKANTDMTGLPWAGLLVTSASTRLPFSTPPGQVTVLLVLVQRWRREERGVKDGQAVGT